MSAHDADPGAVGSELRGGLTSARDAASLPKLGAQINDPQRHACYAWERELVLPDDPAPAFPVGKPFDGEFRTFHERTWRWGFARFGGGHKLVTATAPHLRYSYQLRRVAGHASLRFDRAGRLGPVITFGQRGPTRKILLHEQAHLLTFTGGAFFESDGHGPRFCEIALALYEEFFGVNRSVALVVAWAQGLAIAGSDSTNGTAAP